MFHVLTYQRSARLHQLVPTPSVKAEPTGLVIYRIISIMCVDEFLLPKNKGKVIPLQARFSPEGGERYSSTLP